MWTLISLWCMTAGLAQGPAQVPTARELERAEQVWGTQPERVEASVVAFSGGRRSLLRPYVAGRPVLGAEVLQRVNQAGVVRELLGGAALGEVVPAASGVSPLPIAARAAAFLGEGELWAPRVTEVYLADGGALVEGWQVELSTRAPLGTWRMVIRGDGSVVSARPMSAHAVGRVFESNPLAGGLVDVTLPELEQGALVGPYVRPRTCTDASLSDSLFGASSCNVAEGTALPDEAGDYLFEPVYSDEDGAPDPFAEVHLYYHVDLVARFFDERFGLITARPMNVYTGFTLANAFFGDFDGDGSGDLSFGEVNGVDFSYDADVAYHEFGHSVVSQLAQLPFVTADEVGLEWVAGSVNEGAADVIAMWLTNDPLVGEWAGSAFRDGPIRDLSSPRSCPDDLEGEVHADGEILGAFAWSMMSHPYVGRDAMGEMLVAALPMWRGNRFSWKTVGQSLRGAARDMNEAGSLSDSGFAAVVEALDAQGLRDCGRIADLAEGQTVSRYVLYAPLPGDFARLPGGSQVAIVVPEDGSTIRVTLDNVVERSGEMGVAGMFRVNEPVEMKPSVFAPLGLALAVPQTYDLLVDGIDEVSVTVGPNGQLEAEPGDVLYVAWASRAAVANPTFAFTFGRMDLHYERVVVPVIEPVLRNGRACGSAAGGPLSAWGLLCAMLAVLRRRR